MHENFWIGNYSFFQFHPLEKFREIIRRYKSPYYLYSKAVIKYQFNLLRNNLPGVIDIFYAQKSNPNTEVLKLLNEIGAGCDTASIGEVRSSLAAGFSNERIMITGPGKNEEEIAFAIENDLLSINVESIQELELIDSIAKEKKTVQDILVRINPTFSAGETSRIIGGMGPSKFGIDIEQIPLFMMSLRSKPNVRLKGIHIFNSSQILSYKKIFKNTKNVIETAKDLEKKFGIQLDIIDLGGGFGIPYSEDEESLNIDELGVKLKSYFKKEQKYLRDKRLIFEPGRYLTGPAGIFLTKVLYTKSSLGKNIAITDGGIHHLVRPVLINQKHPMINISALLDKRSNKDFYVVAGPLCTSLDQFDEYAYLDEVKPGDILGILNAGAYGYTESMPYFLSHTKTGEKFID